MPIILVLSLEQVNHAKQCTEVGDCRNKEQPSAHHYYNLRQHPNLHLIVLGRHKPELFRKQIYAGVSALRHIVMQPRCIYMQLQYGLAQGKRCKRERSIGPVVSSEFDTGLEHQSEVAFWTVAQWAGVFERAVPDQPGIQRDCITPVWEWIFFADDELLTYYAAAIM